MGNAFVYDEDGFTTLNMAYLITAEDEEKLNYLTAMLKFINGQGKSAIYYRVNAQKKE